MCVCVCVGGGGGGREGGESSVIHHSYSIKHLCHTYHLTRARHWLCEWVWPYCDPPGADLSQSIHQGGVGYLHASGCYLVER